MINNIKNNDNITNSINTKNVFNFTDLYTILLDQKLGGGAFGKIYTCINNKTKEINACKIENNTEKPQLSNEFRIFNILKNIPGFPKCIKFSNSQKGYLLIMEHLGPNLETIMTRLPNKKYSMKTTLMIILQCLDRIKDIHEKGIIHRDMKPDNFVIGYKGKEKLIYLIDFGLSKIINNNEKKNILQKKEKIIMGTMRYISMNAHLGNEQTKKDDLESLAYIVVYFIKGELPWQNVKADSKKEKYKKVYQIKKQTVPNELCKFLPEDIKTFINCILSLNIKQKPDYQKLKNILENLMNKYSYSNDLQFDWCTTYFMNKLYTSNFVDENNIKSSSIFEEDIDSDDNIKKSILPAFSPGKKIKDKEKDNVTKSKKIQEFIDNYQINLSKLSGNNVIGKKNCLFPHITSTKEISRMKNNVNSPTANLRRVILNSNNDIKVINGKKKIIYSDKNGNKYISKRLRYDSY